MKIAIIPAFILTSVLTTASADEVLVAEITNEFIYSDFTFGGTDTARIFASIWEDPTGDQANIFNEVFISESVTESDTGSVFVADLNDPAQAAQLARLTNGLPDNLWFGADSAAGKSYEFEPEANLFTNQPGPAGIHITGPDLENYTPTRIELQLDALSFISDSPFLTSVVGAITIRIYAQAEISVTVDIGGANYWGLEGDPDNESRVFDLATQLGLPPFTPMMVRATAAQFELTSVNPSLGWHAQIVFDFNNNGTWTLAFWPSLFEPVTQEPVNYGPSFAEVPFIPFSPLGVVRIGFVDHVSDDVPNAPDAFLESGGTASFIVIPACNQADRQLPLGVLDLNDVSQFIGSFLNQLPGGDLAPPFGTFDLNDITVFVNAFNAGCP